ncbi:phosphoenolpyruvate carboxykinase (ATP) [Desulforamulus hydrothermalis]|uniref:phosphoenolpyruvate carboxykinase (ATP) n=1 Tax=Desulforamulus hydrothermalis Lam5 = DSM 18033 TaxID=1121428 RepID=K8DX08_9FIRM|nr:phosphoenolpyruvate carboxykinase (ATP) [Desulforamulus hydrothermalis]CCO07062.1 Phosphoenolpyruvate carboxykinase (ATP) [Desulforamulus hydrothermalis Lam5 = DSM 18033]SHH40468.1 phosphoenolpyruvate carboxykinase (ATP) [Desulforamulus hydrothermalis Lam5 = DSM 18033]
MNKLKRTVDARTIIDNPGLTELRKMASPKERTTKYGSAGFISRMRNRSARATFIVDCEGFTRGVDQQGMPPEKALALAEQVHEFLQDKEVIRMDRQLCLHPSCSFHCRLYITKDYASIPLQWLNMTFAVKDKDAEPDFVTIYVPEWPQCIIFCHPLEKITYILGPDYFGECKKSFLRKAMYAMKEKGGLGFHAGSKVLRVLDVQGELKEVGFIMFGLSGTGKTTLTMHDHGLTEPEKVMIRQDDVVLMDERGYCYGTENGFYIKTEGLDETQRVLFQAAVSPQAIFENVMVLEDGTIDFNNVELTSNGRGVILRSEVIGTDDKIDLEKAHKIIFITRRNDILPPVAKLTPEQAAAYFMLGESIETSAGDPSRAGQSKREVGTNPFIMGPEADEGNRLLDILKANPDMECYLLNTGAVGARPGRPGQKITIAMSTTIMKEIARGNIQWQQDPDWGYQVPAAIPGIEIAAYLPRHYYDHNTYQELVNNLRQERRNWLNKYQGLRSEILQAVEPPGS